MRVLVTGGAGYIGSVITDQLISDGHAVVVYDNLSKGHAYAVSPDATFVEADLLDQNTLQHTLAEHQIDAVIHMAASSLVGESMTDPGRYYMNNVVASTRLLDALVQTNIQMLVFSSTAAVYGEPERQPISEGDPTAPSNTYGETKLAVERAMSWYHRAHGLRYVALRYFNAAGATAERGERHDPETHLIPLVLRAAKDPRSPITVFGNDYPTRDGTCVRDYVHVSDLARAHVLALEALSRQDILTDTFNLGCGDGYTVKEVVDAAKAITGREIPVNVGPRRAGDPAVLVASSARIAKTLGWRPQQSSLEAIVGSAWKWETTFSESGDANHNTEHVNRAGAATT
ncbi:MAG TPA: UDP-glucose 4-epimerase GalE [Vicinamibacterales bacterium]|nr:UDP-glucose 4-epimerase GalE [Vicinamibacterales bacterium]